MTAWTDAPTGDGWYWVRLPRTASLYMTLVHTGKHRRHVYMFKDDNTLGSGGSIEDVARAKGKWQAVKAPEP